MNVSTMRIVTGILGMLLSALCAGMGVSAAVAGASLLEAAVIWFCAALLGVGITVCGIAPHRPQRMVLVAFFCFLMHLPMKPAGRVWACTRPFLVWGLYSAAAVLLLMSHAYVLAFLLFVTDWWLHRLVSLNS